MSLITRTALRIARGKPYVEIVDLFAAGLDQGLLRLSDRRPREDIEAIRKQAAESVALFAANEKGSFLSLREQLTDSVLGMGTFGALVVNPEPEPDSTGLRGEIGISGQLRDRISEIYAAENYMPQYKFEKSPSHTELYHATFFILDIFWTLASAWNYARVKTEGKTNPDWFKPYLAIATASEEDRFRSLLGLPSLLKDQHPWGDMAPLLFQTFFALVASGSPDPYAEWLRDAERA